MFSKTDTLSKLPVVSQAEVDRLVNAWTLYPAPQEFYKLPDWAMDAGLTLLGLVVKVRRASIPSPRHGVPTVGFKGRLYARQPGITRVLPRRRPGLTILRHSMPSSRSHGPGSTKG